MPLLEQQSARSASTMSARLLAPEQFTRHILSQFGLDLSKPYKGQTSALQRYLMPLGGIDHDTVYERDRQIKVQTLLAVQAIAWEAALRIMEQEQKPKFARIFLQDNPNLLTPDSNRNVWIERLRDSFILIHSQLPTDPEINFFERKFRQLLQQDATPLQSWTAVVYTLLASVEFWYL